MREIKFRAKQSKYHDWIYGYYLGIRFGHHSFWDIDKEYAVEIDPESLGQYIGWKDQTGKEIFGGDILGYPFDSPVVIEWDNNRCGFRAFDPKDKTYSLAIPMQVGDRGQAKVISDTYSNPELIPKI
jgi:hypothetical protein